MQCINAKMYRVVQKEVSRILLNMSLHAGRPSLEIMNLTDRVNLQCYYSTQTKTKTFNARNFLWITSGKEHVTKHALIRLCLTQFEQCRCHARSTDLLYLSSVDCVALSDDRLFV